MEEIVLNNFTEDQVASVVRHLVRVSKLYDEFQSLLVDTCFRTPDDPTGVYVGDSQELPWLYIWQGLKKYYAEQVADEAPSRSMLEHYVKENIRVNDLFIDEETAQRLYDEKDPSSGYLAYVFDDVDINEVTGRPLIKDFLKERTVKEALRKLTSDVQDTGQMTSKLSEIADRSNMIDAAGNQGRIIELIPDQCFFDTLPEERNLVPTGIPYIDTALGGGMRHEVHGICGTTGAGKTTLGISLFVEGGKRAFTDATLAGTTPKICLYYTFEENYERLVSNIVGYGALIRRDQLSMTRGTQYGIKNISTDPMNPKDYERETWPDNRVRKSEAERLNEFRTWANRTLFIRNFTGVPNSWESKEEARNTRAVGCDGIDGIRADAASMAKAFGADIHMIVIDYAYIMCKRQTLTARDPERALYSKLRTVADEARTKLVAEFGCPVWMLQQIAGAFLGSSPLKVPTLADVSDCKAMCNDMAAVWTLGVSDKMRQTEKRRTACVYFASVKQRYADGVPPTILQYDPVFPRMNDVTELFTEDRINHAFRSRNQTSVRSEVYDA